MKRTVGLYVCPHDDRTWSVECSEAGEVFIATEREYPVDLYYRRVDLNGSGIVEMETCNDRADLLLLLNWIGQCRFVPLQFWDFDLQRATDKRLLGIFQDAADFRAELAQEDPWWDEQGQNLDDVIAGCEAAKARQERRDQIIKEIDAIVEL